MKCGNDICQNILTKNQSKFCSRSCAAMINNRGVNRHGTARVMCLNCNKPVGRNSTKYCSNYCYNIHKYNDYISKWKSGIIVGNESKAGYVPTPIRRYLFELNNNVCSKCGWGELNPHTKCDRPPLEVDHTDGDCTNNRPENLELLCPNCHSLTSTFGALNESGNGRRKRGLM